MTDKLICPFCGLPLTREGMSLYCPARHCFDLARSGYASLTRTSGTSGDDRNMVRARTEFLDQDYYRPFADAVLAAADGYHTVVDAGCGEGYYSVRLARAGHRVYGFDLSKAACDHAARRAKAAGISAAFPAPDSVGQAFFGVAGISHLPIADGAADAVINLFAPVDEAEFTRILRPGGRLIIGGAAPRHLFEFKQAIYDTVYENEGRRDLPRGLIPEDHRRITCTFLCEGAHLRPLLAMTPYAFKTSPADAARLDRLDRLEITADFDIFIYRKK